MRYFVTTILLLAAGHLFAQESDSLIINVGKSQLIIVVNDPADLDKLAEYDLNAILNQLKLKLTEDSVMVTSDNQVVSDTTIAITSTNSNDNEDWRTRRDDSWRDRDNDRWRNRDSDRWRDRDSRERDTVRRPYSRRFRHLINFDLGTNNYLSNGEFPDNDNALYAVRPWGSWYFGINSIYQVRLPGRFYLEIGPGISWYNFKFQEDRTRIIDVNGVTTFIEDPDAANDYKKSKLTASFINASLVPMYQFGRERRRRSVGSWNNWSDINITPSSGGFRIGVGGYAGYRLGSHSKVKFQGGKKDKDRDDFNLTNFRYGVRAQIGFKGTDLFFNYDLNELFRDGRGPELNAFSFGIVL